MKKLIIALLLILATDVDAAQLLPNGKQCFTKTNGLPAVGGSINMFVPNTNTPKPTWQDSGQSILNTQPIQLDGNGCAIIYGTGIYRQQLYDGPVVGSAVSGILIWDQFVTDPSSFGALAWGGIATGTPNAITVNFPGFSAVDGSPLQFQALFTNTGPTTITIPGTSLMNVPVTRPGPSGPVPLVAGNITANTVTQVVYLAASNTFQITNSGGGSDGSAGGAAVVIPPQGYLTLSSDAQNPVQTADINMATTIYYTAFSGNTAPVWNGTTFGSLVISQLQLLLPTSLGGSTVYDACIFSNAGTPTLVAGPGWPTLTSRGTGTGSAQIIRLNGIWVNANQITGLNGTSSFIIPVDQCTYVGSFYTDTAAGQVSSQVTYGQNRKWGVWNAYNRQPIQVKAGDPATSWVYNTNAWRNSNNNAGNNITVLSGLAEEPYALAFRQRVQVNGSGTADLTGELQIGIGFNVSNAPSGLVGDLSVTAGTAGSGITADVFVRIGANAEYALAPSLGVNTINAIEIAPVANFTKLLWGTETNMLLTARWRG
jgi:hypothetical protein